jgi:putative protein-disulfide isomerase
MCSWCWGFRPVWDELQQTLPPLVDVVGVVGGLAKDCDDPMPQDLRLTLQSTWHKIRGLLDTEFNFDFWVTCQPRRSTFQACRAVVAATFQNHEKEMIDAIQRAYYLRAMNPSNTTTLLALAAELGLNVDRFIEDLQSEQLQTEFSRQLKLARSLPISGFPSLILQVKNQMIPVELDYKNHKTMREQINDALTMF